MAWVTELQPDVYVKGGDYYPRAAPGQKGFLPEAACAARYGGRVAILSYLPGHSTSALVHLIVSRYTR